MAVSRLTEDELQTFGRRAYAALPALSRARVKAVHLYPTSHEGSLRLVVYFAPCPPDQYAEPSPVLLSKADLDEKEPSDA